MNILYIAGGEKKYLVNLISRQRDVEYFQAIYGR